MPQEQITVWRFICERCKHKWFPRDAESKEPVTPRVCPKCKSPYWNTPRKTAKVPSAQKNA